MRVPVQTCPGSGCTSPLDTNGAESPSADPAPGLRPRPTPVHSGRAPCRVSPPPAAAAWLHCIGSHTEKHRGGRTNTEELTRMGSVPLRGERVGRAAGWCGAWVGTEGMPSGLGCGLDLQV